MPNSWKLTPPWTVLAILFATAVLLTLVLPASRRGVAEAQSPQCLASGVVVNGDTTGLDVRPCTVPTTGIELNVADTSLDPEHEPPPGNKSSLYWGYSAQFVASPLSARLAVPGDPLVATCVPSGPHIPLASNGRGVAFDPLDGKLWISRLTGFTGDQRITKISPPNVTPGTCPEITSLLVHYPGGVPPQQPDFGALDTDISKHIWAAGYIPVSINGTLRNYFYLVNRNNGLIIHSCYLNTVTTAPGNDSLTYARLSGLPGSGQYLITDNGTLSSTDPLLVIDKAQCHNGRQVTPVFSFPNPGASPGAHAGTGVTGIDFEWLGLLNTDGPFARLFNNGNQPFTTATFLGPTAPPGTGFEDIALCGYRAKFGGDGHDGTLVAEWNDACPFR